MGSLTRCLPPVICRSAVDVELISCARILSASSFFFFQAEDGIRDDLVTGVQTCALPIYFLSVHKSGQVAIVETRGNDDCHIILRGGRQPNYDAASVQAACEELERAKLPQRLMIDCSHANAAKQYKRQADVAADIAKQLTAGEKRIVGVMIESHLVEGRQELEPGKPLRFGQSITDACLGWDDSVRVLDTLAQGAKQRRKHRNH